MRKGGERREGGGDERERKRETDKPTKRVSDRERAREHDASVIHSVDCEEVILRYKRCKYNNTLTKGNLQMR